MQRHNVSKQTARNLFICPSTTKVAEFYQHLLTGITTYEVLAARVLTRIRTACAFRQVDQVRELSSILINIPIREYRLIAQYYLVWCEFRESICSYAILESVIEQTQAYKSKALIWRGTLDVYNGHSDTALHFYAEALKADPTASDCITASRGIALVKALEGFHASALKDLERLLPLLRHAEPMAYYEVINSYAVELMEAGRFEEARNASQIALASPLAGAYPEWRETRAEIELRGYRASRSTVAVKQRSFEADNLMRLPAREPVDSLASGSLPPGLPARVLSFLEGKKKMVKESNGPPDEKKNYKDMTGKDLLLRIMELTGSSDRTDYELYQIVEAIEGVLSKPKAPDKQ
jgi:tetratricopeptide (TPR) repeat protein